jgi:hypothetical protein
MGGLVTVSSQDGATPTALILGSDGTIHGITTAGGPNNLGAVFEFYNH